MSKNQSRLGRNPLQKKKVTAASRIMGHDEVESPAETRPTSTSPRVELAASQPLTLMERLQKMDIRLDVKGLLKHVTGDR